MVTEQTGYIIMFFVLVVSITIITVLYLMRHQTGGTTKTSSTGPIPEIAYSEKMDKYALSAPLDLIDILTNDNGTKFWCTPTFYAVRPVNIVTGDYGKLSPWSIFPVVANPRVRSPNTQVAERACTMIGAIVGIIDKVDVTDTDIKYQIHRQVGTINIKSSGTPIGVMIPAPRGIKVSSGKIVTYNTTFIDKDNPTTTLVCSDC